MSERTILYIEDDDLVARGVLRMRDLGAVLTWQASISEARAWLAENRERTVAALVDEGLPDGDGVRLARELAENGVPVGIVSGSHPPEGESLPWLTKPFSRGELRSFIAALQRSRET